MLVTVSKHVLDNITPLDSYYVSRFQTNFLRSSYEIGFFGACFRHGIFFWPLTGSNHYYL